MGKRTKVSEPLVGDAVHDRPVNGAIGVNSNVAESDSPL